MVVVHSQQRTCGRQRQVDALLEPRCTTVRTADADDEEEDEMTPTDEEAKPAAAVASSRRGATGELLGAGGGAAGAAAEAWEAAPVAPAAGTPLFGLSHSTAGRFCSVGEGVSGEATGATPSAAAAMTRAAFLDAAAAAAAEATAPKPGCCCWSETLHSEGASYIAKAPSNDRSLCVHLFVDCVVVIATPYL